MSWRFFSFRCLLSRGRLWFQSTAGRVFGAALLIGLLTTFVKATAFGKEILVARYFGANDALDSFYAAYVVPSFLIGVFGNACSDAFIPTYLQLCEREGQVSAQRLLSSVTTLCLVVLLALSLVLALSQDWILPVLGSSFGPAKMQRTRLLFFLLVSALTLSAVSAVWRAVLNAHERFTLTAITPLAFPLSIIILLVLRAPEWGVYALVAGSILGVVAELTVNGYGVASLGLDLLPHWYGFDFSLRQVLSQSVPAIAAALLMGSTVLVDQSMAAMLGSGSISVLNYANRLVAIVLSIGTTSLSIAIFPTLSRLCARADWRALRRIVATYSYLIVLLTVPVTAIMCGFSGDIVRLSFQRGAFTSETALLVARVQTMLALELPFYALCILCASAICALKRNALLLYGTALSVVVNIVLNYLFMKPLGLPGIALSTSVVYVVSFLYLRISLSRALRKEEVRADALSEIAEAATA